ncbi:unnamed protein product [Trifolium pratense]|uniref:Uncharacterized protein n=1 Tax=Trifolium pratense TaxID=57577 RepID=A0ACB0L8P4_TRIPR|nr:unnamed protein product [Trifolium pratense]
MEFTMQVPTINIQNILTLFALNFITHSQKAPILPSNNFLEDFDEDNNGVVYPIKNQVSGVLEKPSSSHQNQWCVEETFLKPSKSFLSFTMRLSLRFTND